MTETTQSNGATGPIVNMHDPFGEQQAAQETEQKPQTDEQEPQDGNTEQDASDTSSGAGEQDQDPTAKAKAGTPKGVQKRLDELTRQRSEAQQEAEHWRRQAEQASRIAEQAMRGFSADDEGDDITSQPPRQDGRPDPKQFRTDLEYVEALTDWKLEQRLKQRDAEREERARAAALDKAEQAAKAKHADYQEGIAAFAGNQALLRNPAVVNVLRESEIGPEIAYYLGKHPEVADSLNGLSDYRAAARLGAIEEQLLAKPSESKPDTKKPDLPKPPDHEVRGKAPANEWQDPNVIDVKRNVEITRQRYISQGLRPPY